MKIIHKIELTQEELSKLLDFSMQQRKLFNYELTNTFVLMGRDPVIYVFEFSPKEEK